MTRLLPYLNPFRDFQLLLEKRSKSQHSLHDPLWSGHCLPLNFMSRYLSYINKSLPLCTQCSSFPLIPAFSTVILSPGPLLSFPQFTFIFPRSQLYLLSPGKIYLVSLNRSSPNKVSLNIMDFSFLARITVLILCLFWVVT